MDPYESLSKLGEDYVAGGDGGVGEIQRRKCVRERERAETIISLRLRLAPSVQSFRAKEREALVKLRLLGIWRVG
jgi:hypothetical protein